MSLNSCSLPCGEIVRLRNIFLCRFDLKLLSFVEFFDHLNQLEEAEREEHVESVLQNTINNPLVKKLPLKTSYCKSFLKILIENVEKLDCNYSSLYETYVNVLQMKDEFSYYYRHFCIGDRVVSVKENSNVICEGTTGLSVWQGGIALAQWCLDNPQITESQSVLELGCGLGLTGLIVSLSHCKPTSYCFTDFHPNVLQSLKSNIELNSINFKCEVDISLITLDWNEIDKWNSSFRPTVILAADIVYDPELFPSIYKTLNFLLKMENTRAYIACTIRDETTLDLFVEGLIRNNLIIQSKTEIIPHKLYFSREPPVILLSIQCAVNDR